MITVRNLRANEKIPEHFRTGYEQMPVMPDWCWLAEENGVPIGALLAAPLHGVLYLLRIYVVDGVSSETTTYLLRKCFTDSKERGMCGFMTHVNPIREAEGKILAMCERWGGFQAPELQVAIAGPLTKNGWKSIPRKRILEMF